MMHQKIKSIALLSIVAMVSLTACGEENVNTTNTSKTVKLETKLKGKEKKQTGAFLEITLKVNKENRTAAAGIYSKYKTPFLEQIDGASSKELLIRTEDVQVIHGFETEAQAKAYLSTSLFSDDIVGELGPLLAADPEIRIYSTAAKTQTTPKSTGAFLEISLKIESSKRASAGKVYSKYKNPFLSQIEGATSKELIIREDDVQVLHGFETVEQANSYLKTELFTNDVVRELGPLLSADPEVRIYSIFK